MPPATLTIAASKANRSVSKLLRAAKEGTVITITLRGKPVAQLRPVGPRPEDAQDPS